MMTSKRTSVGTKSNKAIYYPAYGNIHRDWTEFAYSVRESKNILTDRNSISKVVMTPVELVKNSDVINTEKKGSNKKRFAKTG